MMSDGKECRSSDGQGEWKDTGSFLSRCNQTSEEIKCVFACVKRRITAIDLKKLKEEVLQSKYGPAEIRPGYFYLGKCKWN